MWVIYAEISRLEVYADINILARDKAGRVGMASALPLIHGGRREEENWFN